jgi:hypothetical protein
MRGWTIQELDDAKSYLVNNINEYIGLNKKGERMCQYIQILSDTNKGLKEKIVKKDNIIKSLVERIRYLESNATVAGL